jgi:hypothetical protein
MLSQPVVVFVHFIRFGLKKNSMSNAPLLGVMDFLGPAIAALAFVLLNSQVSEPTRRT